MFFGEYPYKVDEKGRLPLPPKFRREMKDGVILTKGMENYIAVYPIAEWKRLSDSLAAKAVTPTNLRKLNRAIFGSAFSASFDGQGRITLPYSLRDHAKITDTAVVVGANNCVELWSEDEWKIEKTSAEEQASQIIESFGEQ
ncbi:MAG: division/cell wall cluster transcriptional repressor MraZ [Dehalococcoidia bacterium]|nr:division/cell wall cluster transcriptional repressor MraZ [Dehalococcoidia bacterium]RLC65024.1 MAG: division/cell wall cluster transcriptional repressor MraZ [Chloroflexota bacterium]